MRNALIILSVFLFVFTAGLTHVIAAVSDSAATSSVYAMLVYGIPLSDRSPQSQTATHSYDQQLLPVRGTDLPLPSGTSLTTTGDSQQVSAVEAIPTPTAFHAGAVLLLTIFAVRLFRKLRFA
jgi:hypothetical protein